MAEKLAADLEGKVPAKIELLATKYAGHGEEVATNYASDDAKVLLVSSSGDGGYHELINGALSHQTQNVYTMVLPGGNANDHHHATASDNLAERIITPRLIQIDALKLESRIDNKPWQRYAHSYAGIGLTAYIGQKLIDIDLNPVNEKIILLKYLRRFGWVTAKLGHGRWRRYSSLLFGNIDQMSKVLTLGDNTRPDDGKFEIYATPAKTSWSLVRTMLVGTMSKIEQTDRVESASFMTKRSTGLQCDGEIYSLEAKTPVTVSSAPGALRTLA